MNQAQLRKIWNRTKTDAQFRRLLLALLAALVTVPSPAKDQLAACALADYTLRKAGAAGGRELKRRLRTVGWNFIPSSTQSDGLIHPLASVAVPA
jgi:hypothetical protein